MAIIHALWEGLTGGHGTWDEWLLLIQAIPVWALVLELAITARNAGRWSCNPRSGSSARTRRQVAEHYRQERVRFFVATLFLVAGVVSVISWPPNPEMLRPSARWKLWVIILADASVGYQSLRARISQLRDAREREAEEQAAKEAEAT